MKPYKNRPKIIKGDRGIKTSDVVATFGLPEVNVYPDNKWGDIARSQGLETARNWRTIKSATTKGINNFGSSIANPLYTISSFLPIVGDSQDIVDFYQSYKDNDKTGMVLSLSGVIPFIGNISTQANKFRKLRTFTDSDFGKLLGRGEEASVFENPKDLNTVLKVYNDPHNLEEAINKSNIRNSVPYQEKLNFIGFKDNSYPVYSQNKVTPISEAEFTPEIELKIKNMLKRKGFKYDPDEGYSNGTLNLLDISSDNVGYNKKGQLRFFDVGAY